MITLRVMYSLSMCYNNYCVPSHNKEYSDTGVIVTLEENEHIEDVGIL